MKIALCTLGNNLDAKLDDRFGRAEKFIIVDTENDSFKVIDNIAKNEAGGAGGLAVRNLASERVECVIVPQLGPKAETALKAFEIKAFQQGDAKIVSEALEKFKNNELTKLLTATVEEHAGLRRV
jgi:predicted Fe-Mo cluster-binding NifX family protein